MNIISYTNELNIDAEIEKIYEFFNMNNIKLHGETLQDFIKELCVARLCKAVGLSNYNYKSDFFNFFANIMGEAVCEKLEIKAHVACDDLRFCKFEHINLIKTVKSYLDKSSVEEAFLDAFELVDKFKYLIPKLKKV